MRIRLIAPLTAALVAGTIGLTAGTAGAAPAASAAPAAASQARSLATATAPLPDAVTAVGTFTNGSFTPTGFTSSNGQVTVTGLITGTLTDLNGGMTQVSQQASAPIIAAPPAPNCTILDLILGPLHLDLLGLVVDLNQVHLVITAVPGPGNLLGNLLCAVANLLNGGNVGGLGALLSRLLGL